MFSKEAKSLLLIITIFIAACIETDIYLPTFTDMMAYFSISEEAVQSLLTWNFVGICISGPFYGPISDAFGRRKPLLIALGLFLAGSIITVLASEFPLMLVGRILQGLGSGGCFTLGTAILFDLFEEGKAVEALNRINTIVPFIMAGAPMLGGFLNNSFGFRSNFIAIALCVLASYIVCHFMFAESLPEEKRKPFDLGKIARDFCRVTLSLPFLQTMGVVSLIFAGYLAFLSTAAVLFVLELGVAKEMLPFYQMALLGSWLVANLTFNRIFAKLGATRTKSLGTWLLLLSGLGIVASVWAAPENPLPITAALSVYAVGANWTQGLYFTEGMALFPDIRGIAASFLTSARLLICAVVVGISSAFYDATIYPIAIILGIVITVTLALIVTYERSRRGVASQEELKPQEMAIH